MFEQSNEIFEIIRSTFFTYLILLIAISPAFASKDFQSLRLQQFELHGISSGTSGALLNLETRILLPGSPIVTSPRRCYVVKLVDLTVAMYRDLLKHSVAGILIIVPPDLNSISDEIKEQIEDLEQTMLEEATTVPVYFVVENKDVAQLYKTVKRNADVLNPKSSGLENLMHSITGNGVTVVSSLGTPKAVTDAQITSIQGNLIGSKVNNNFPILICSHYDSMSSVPELSFGYDSNASGTVLLLELARLFSHLYSNRGSSGKVGGRQPNSLLFLLSGAGHFNYQGTQKYLEDQLDSLEHSDLQDLRLAVCLDSLGKNKNELYIHVSRSIREGTMLHAFIQNVKEIASQLYPDLKVELIQRKVKTENLLSWEHEKFHLKKINAVTLSSHRDASQIKPSLLDSKDNVDINDLMIKTHVIAEAVASITYNVSGNDPIFSGSLSVSKTSLSSMLDFVASQPRSAQLLATKQNKFVQALRNVLARYTHETSLFYMKPDKRDANLVFYDSTSGTITAYDVKPAVFDLILSIAVAAYLSVVYFGLKHFHLLLDQVSVKKAEVNSNGLSGNHLNQKSKVQ